MALLVFGDLGVGVGRRVADDNGNFLQTGAHCSTQSLGTEVQPVAAIGVNEMNDQRLQDAVLPNVFGEFIDLGFGELGARIVWVFVDQTDRNARRQADNCSGCPVRDLERFAR